MKPLQHLIKIMQARVDPEFRLEVMEAVVYRNGNMGSQKDFRNNELACLHFEAIFKLI